MSDIGSVLQPFTVSAIAPDPLPAFGTRPGS